MNDWPDSAFAAPALRELDGPARAALAAAGRLVELATARAVIP